MVESFEGRVIRIAPIVSASTGGSGGSGSPAQTPYTFPVWLEIDSKGKKLAAGMNGYALFKREFETLAVPQSALMRYSGGEGVVGVVTPGQSRPFHVSHLFDQRGRLGRDR